MGKNSSLAVSMCGAGAVLATSVIVAAAGTNFAHDTSSHAWTEVSGYAGSIKEVVVGATKGVHGLRFYEEGDDPAFIDVWENRLSTEPGGNARAGKLELKLTFKSGENIEVGEDHYITAMRVCTNGAQDTSERKIKGAEAWGARLNADGSLAPSGATSKFERPNCKHWASKVSCPAGKVATGVRAHYANSTKGFSGLSLRCTRPKTP